MSGFRIVIADLTGRIVADCRHDGEFVRWSGQDIEFGRAAIEMARTVRPPTPDIEIMFSDAEKEKEAP